MRTYVDQLIEKIGEDNVTQKKEILVKHSYDASPHEPAEPDVVCFPRTKEDVQEIIEVARVNQIPVTPYGTGSNLEGQSIPVQGGISINFDNMNQIVDFSLENMTVTVQPGVKRFQLNEFVNPHGLQFPVDPGVNATIGGMVATNASGTTAVRYGAMKDQVLDLQVVLSSGKIIHTGSKAKKSSSGYQLTELFAGSEGTLGIITEVTLKLYAIPEYSAMARCTFDTLEACVGASQALLLKDISLQRVELMDAASIAQVNRQNGYTFPIKPSLFVELAGAAHSVPHEMTIAQQVLTKLGGEDWKSASDPLEQQELWRARYNLSHAFLHEEGMAEVGADVCVPISRLAELLGLARELINQSGLKGGVWGHVGDGNFHTLILFNPSIDGEREKAEAVNDTLAIRAIEVGGTCTGEHGVGIGKQKYQQKEHGEAFGVMQEIKAMFDPSGILNPGKIFAQ